MTSLSHVSVLVFHVEIRYIYAVYSKLNIVIQEVINLEDRIVLTQVNLSTLKNVLNEFLSLFEK